MRQFSDSEIPYFSWDRKVSVVEIRNALCSDSLDVQNRFRSWIMREAAFEDVWAFLTPQEVWDHFSELKASLGRKKDFWTYILRKWHELGKI